MLLRMLKSLGWGFFVQMSQKQQKCYTANRQTLRRHLSAPGLLRLVRKAFVEVPSPVRTRLISTVDYLMSALAISWFKYPSLLEFDRSIRGDGTLSDDETAVRNLKALFGVRKVPCDSARREHLDRTAPSLLHKAFKLLFAAFQRGGELSAYAVLGGYHLVSVDGTGLFSSKTVHCEQCNVKQHKNGSRTYCHQMLGAAVVHPTIREVVPLAPEPILKGDGHSKNDCERNASKRLLRDFRREHPHLKTIIVEDGLASNGPHIELLRELGLSFILGAKPGGHGALFEFVDGVERLPGQPTQGAHRLEVEENGALHRLRYLNAVPLNDTHPDLEVNFLEYREMRNGRRHRHFSWVTDLTLDDNPPRLVEIMRCARARWRIENEVFQTLKARGYHFEHNFGHGDKHLCTVMGMLMMLCLLIDPIRQRCCPASTTQVSVATDARAAAGIRDPRHARLSSPARRRGPLPGRIHRYRMTLWP